VSTQIATIVDYTAYIAAGIIGITAVFGAGGGVISDPLNPGQTIRAAPDAPTGPWTHWSDMPDGKIEPVTQTGTDLYEWDVPMCLWLPRADLANMRRLAMPFYARYAVAFGADRTFGGLCMHSHLFAIGRSGDAKWERIDFNLQVLEEA